MPKKILLVQSYLGRSEPATFPIALATLAARISDNYELSGFDPNVTTAPEEELHTKIHHYRPDVIALSLRNIDTTNLIDPYIHYNGFLKTLEVVREASKDVPLIVGGAGFSLFAERIMQDNPVIDYGIYLEGEDTFVELLDKMNDPDLVKGVYYRQNGKIHFTGRREPVPIDDTLFPLWEIFDVEKYKIFPFPFGVETKRGCPFECVYCSYFVLHGKALRLRQPERVVEEISELRRRFGIKEVCFLDSVFNVPVDHAMAILQLMKGELPDVKWLGYLSERGLTEEFARLAVETGLRVFVFSADSYTDECLQLMGKGITVEHIQQAVEVVRKMPPAHIGFNFFVNGPGYTYGTLTALLWFLLKTKIRLGRRFHFMKLNLGYIRIEPGSPLHRMALQNGHLSPEADLLPLDLEGYERCFYYNNNLSFFNVFFSFVSKGLRRLKGAHPCSRV